MYTQITSADIETYLCDFHGVDKIYDFMYFNK